MESIEEQRNTSRLILVAINESEASDNALQWALNKLITSQDRIILIHARRDPISPIRSWKRKNRILIELWRDSMKSVSAKHFENNIKLSTEEILDKATGVCEAKNVTPETWVYSGDAGHVLCNAAREYNPDMLVMGSHGHGVLKRLFLGSVSDHCVHHVQCPVVVVKLQNNKAR